MTTALGDIYAIQGAPGTPIKIGWAVDAVRRLERLQIGNPAQLRLLGSFAGSWYDERAIHRDLRDEGAWIRGEWYLPVPAVARVFRWGARRCAKAGIREGAKSMAELVLSDDDVERIAAAMARHLEPMIEGRLERMRSTGWIDVAEAAAHLDCQPQRIYDLVSQGRLPHGKDGRRVLFRREDLDNYLVGALGQ